MDIVAATRSYERWLARCVPLRPADLELKHRLMAADQFSFLRATFYRWAQLWPQVCSEIAAAPRCSRWAICTWRTSAPGATRKGG